MTVPPSRGISGDIRVRKLRQPVTRPRPIIPIQRPVPAPTVAKRPRRRFGRRLLELIQYPLIAAIALAAAYNSLIGQWLVLAYAVAALIWRWSSRLSFGLALLVLVSVALFQGLGQSGIAQNAAIYVYELLIVGTAQAIWEQRKIAKLSK